MSCMKNFKISRNSVHRRASETNIQQFLIEFEQCHHKLKRHQTTISEDPPVLKLLKAPNLLIHHKQLKMLPSLTDFETTRAKIKSIFSNSVQSPAIFDHEVKIKAEQTLLTKKSTPEEGED